MVNIGSSLQSLIGPSNQTRSTSTQPSSATEITPEQGLSEKEISSFSMSDLVNQPLKLVYHAAVDRLKGGESTVQPQFIAAYQKNRQYTPETTAGLIIERAAQQLLDQPEDQRETALPGITAAIHKGFEASEHFLQSAGLLNDHVKQQIDGTYQLIEANLLEFAAVAE